jgi:hypothetical protein
MKPLILEYAEKVNGDPLDFSMVEYSYDQNLTVLKSSLVPAVKFMSLETTTFTKSDGESSDTDEQPLSRINDLKSLLDTSTETKTFSETSDSDISANLVISNINNLLDTATKTAVSVGEDSDTDTDYNIKALRKLLDTKTLTENVETSSDNDR